MAKSHKKRKRVVEPATDELREVLAVNKKSEFHGKRLEVRQYSAALF
jgi:hypothetical protein